MKKKRSILIYADDKVTLGTQLTIQVDNAGDEWLTPEQAIFLENAHLWARYAFSHQLKASRPLVRRWTLPLTEVAPPISSNVSGNLVRSTPAFNGATI